VKLKRVTAIQEIKEGSLLRAPKELTRLKNLYSLQQGQLSVNPETYASGLAKIHEEDDEVKPLVTSLSVIANLAVFLLLAF
ncbi:MAG: hypothetical protein KDD22_02480, partial [Bdellovibrionales bacterium]|nr:hypothetical protein [Bdellovibrionales bacterium]